MQIIVSHPADSEDRHRLYRFLYRIWTRESDRELPGTDHENQEIRDSQDSTATHFMALDSQGQIAGCVRANRLSNLMQNQGLPDQVLQEYLGLENLANLFSPENVVLISHLAISPAHRGGTVISLLLADLFRTLFENRANVAVCHCRLNLVSLYYRIGLRPYLPNFKLQDQLQVPLIGCINDRKYLERAGSPLHALLPADCDDRGWAADLLTDSFPMFTGPEVSDISTRNLWARLAHASPAGQQESGVKLFQGFSPAAVEDLLTQMPRIRLAQHETVQTGRNGDEAMGILISGALGIGVGDVSDPHFVYVVQPGEPFGEQTALSRGHTQSVIVSLAESEVLLLPGRLLERLAARDAGSALILYKNLLGILAGRVEAANAVLAEHLSEKVRPDTRVHRPARHLAQSARQAVNRKESYDYASLSDRKGELDRLTCQARVAETLEVAKLRKIGLANGDRILDLGSGPGVTSMILARHFPDSRIHGVEPEDKLRHLAEERAAEQCPGRCTFHQGTAQAIPLPDNHVDFSYARLLFQHIPDPLVCLKEMKRVTRPGGIVCILDVDDGTIFIHPEAPEWSAVENRVARAQAASGGDRHVGRKLLGFFEATGFSEVQVDVVPVTTQMLGPDLFFDIVFGFKQQHLKRCGDWDQETAGIFSHIRSLLGKPGAFASENMFVAHGLVE
ncbi:MAG: GNAT family N-acetyltransferase [Desulfobacterales bacterium]|nr:GNAT family N-acetyltransferase [Desulfobacterales bacterium]